MQHLMKNQNQRQRRVNLMLVVNLFAGSGARKSTTAAGVFQTLKRKDINCEFVTNYAKDLAWDESYKVFLNLVKQNHQLRKLEGKVDVVITDSPILLSILYNKVYSHSKNLNDFIIDTFNKYNNMNYFLKKAKKCNSTEEEAKELDIEIISLLDFNQTEEEAKKLDIKVKSLLDLYNVDYTEIEYNADTVDIICDNIIRRLS